MPRIYVSDYFLKQMRRMKKYRHLAEDIMETLRSFVPEHTQSLHSTVFKLRFRSRDVAKGKSGSFRLIVLVLKLGDVVTPATLYFKGDIQDITEQEIKYHVEMVLLEIRSKGILE